MEGSLGAHGGRKPYCVLTLIRRFGRSALEQKTGAQEEQTLLLQKGGDFLLGKHVINLREHILFHQKIRDSSCLSQGLVFVDCFNCGFHSFNYRLYIISHFGFAGLIMGAEKKP